MGMVRPDSPSQPGLPAISPKQGAGAGRRWWWAVALLAVILIAGGVWLVRARSVLRDADDARDAITAGRYDQADGPLRRWLQARPESAEAHFLRAQMALALERPQEVIHHAAAALSLGHPRPPIDRLIAILKARAGLYEEAEPILRSVLAEARGPEPEASRALARILIETFRLLEVQPVIDRWIRDDPTNPEPFLLKAELGVLADESPSALIEYYRAALRCAPNLDKAHLGLAEQLSKAHRYEEASAEYAAYIERNPNDPSGYLGAGRVALDLGDLTEAIRHIGRALEIAPDDTAVLREGAAVALASNRPSEALRFLDRAIEHDPYHAETRYRRSNALKQLGRRQEAMAEHETSLRLREEEQRMEVIRNSLLKDPGNLELKVESIRLMLQRGQREEGLRWAFLVLRNHPNHREIHRILAEYYKKEGNIGLANYHGAVADGSALSDY